MYEVELKFPLADSEPVLRKLAELGASRASPLEQADAYFNHPAHDFAQTDEALRIRSSGDQHFLTYKGPVVDSRTKTRHEIEMPIGSRESRDQLAEILSRLGFRPVREVRKMRQPFHLTWQDRQFEIALDQVADLGTFVEVETLASESQRAAAVETILKLAATLGLSEPERKSYLCLVLEKSARNP